MSAFLALYSIKVLLWKRMKSFSFLQLPNVSDGVLIHGLYTDAFRFDSKTMKMASECDRVMNEMMPLLHMEPRMDFTPPEEDYMCPLYKTGARAGVLSTTGSFNFRSCNKLGLFTQRFVRVTIS